MLRHYSLPEALQASIANALGSHDLTLQDSRELAECALKLSDYFIQKPEAPTPWHENWALVGYLCYYLPLNFTRLMRIIEEAQQREFFTGLDHVIDFGAGLATASLALSENCSFKCHLIEKSLVPQKIIDTFFTRFHAVEWLRNFRDLRLREGHKTLAVFSYSLTELPDLPDWALECEALMLVEPSTQQDGRRLLQLRSKLIEKGYHIWAPCTHESPCPLLTHTKKDWCHDRLHFQAPDWFSKMEEHLPMKNRTLTMSYLLARRTPPKKMALARVVGDRLQENGKDRQLICRGPDREFLAWMHKNKIFQEIPRGALIEIPQDVKKISNELRVQSAIKL